MKNTNSTILQSIGPDRYVAAFFVRGRKILIGLRHYTDGSVWTTPGGRCEAGETIEQALRRETFEEVGIQDFEITAHIGEVKAATSMNPLSSFICVTQEQPCLMEPEKFSEWRWCDVEEIPENFINIPALELARDFIDSFSEERAGKL